VRCGKGLRRHSADPVWRPVTFLAVIVAGGLGQRAGPGPAKQWRSLAGKPVIRWSLEAMLAAKAAQVVVVVPEGAEATAEAALEGLPRWSLAVGGRTRAESTLAGLNQLAARDDDIVLIHDAARPFLAPRHIAELLEALRDSDGAAPALAVSDTLKRRESPHGPVSTAPREELWRVQTPQAFRYGHLTAAYAAWPMTETATDDAGVVERFGGKVVLTPGDPRLMKLTYPEDFAMAEVLAGGARQTRIGQGFDAHRFGAGTAVWLCGVKIAHDRGLIGHSDADVGLHALTDALLGAAGEGDIGDHFPPTDPRWKDASSDLFLRHAAALIAARGGHVSNVDVTLICEAPKIKPYRQAMREMLAKILGLSIENVSVKATTTEGMGFTGRGEGLAGQAVAAIELPA
jgi:2-C-methyl-D-erythritol 4-phosphate cytidylyltransferase / 2-C-methyl-D-erythritol 2,4-cyclodiphosphate synthase